MFSWNPVYFEMSNIVFGHSEFHKRNDPDEKVSVIIL